MLLLAEFLSLINPDRGVGGARLGSHKRGVYGRAVRNQCLEE